MESGLYILYKPKFIWSKREASAHQINWRSFKFTVFLSSLRLSKGCFVSVLKMTTFCHFPIPMLTYQTPKHCTEVCNTKINDFTALDGKHFIFIFIFTNIMLKRSLWSVQRVDGRCVIALQQTWAWFHFFAWWTLVVFLKVFCVNRLTAGLKSHWTKSNWIQLIKSTVTEREASWQPFLPSDGVETSSENGCSYVTSRSGHTGYSGPIVCSDVVDLDRVEVWNAIKASDYIDVVI